MSFQDRREALVRPTTIKISMPSGTLIDTPIVYDNKEDTSITKKDREKAKYYRDNHNTDYLIIVSNRLPKDIKNGCIGQKDGILGRRDIVVEVARDYVYFW